MIVNQDLFPKFQTIIFSIIHKHSLYHISIRILFVLSLGRYNQPCPSAISTQPCSSRQVINQNELYWVRHEPSLLEVTQPKKPNMYLSSQGNPICLNELSFLEEIALVFPDVTSIDRVWLTSFSCTTSYQNSPIALVFGCKYWSIPWSRFIHPTKTCGLSTRDRFLILLGVLSIILKSP